MPFLVRLPPSQELKDMIRSNGTIGLRAQRYSNKESKSKGNLTGLPAIEKKILYHPQNLGKANSLRETEIAKNQTPGRETHQKCKSFGSPC
jgi:hypothetical protein